MRALPRRLGVAIGLLVGCLSLVAGSPRAAYACSGGEPFDPNRASLIAEGRVERVTLRQDLRPPATPGAKGGGISPFTPVEVSMRVERTLKGQTAGRVTFIERSSVEILPDGRVIYAGASGACGILDADPTGKYALIVFTANPQGQLAVHRLQGAAFGDGPDDLRIARSRQYIGSRLTPGLPSTGAGGAGATAPRRGWHDELATTAILVTAAGLLVAGGRYRHKPA